MQYACYFSSIETRLNVTDVLVKICNIKFHKTRPVRAEQSQAVSFRPTSADEREEEPIPVTGPTLLRVFCPSRRCHRLSTVQISPFKPRQSHCN